jgi:electron transport complex protein RnfB
LTDRSSGARVASAAVAAGTRDERLASRERNPKWQNAPLWIDMSICINCDTCIRWCPPQFGAIFNHGIDVVIIPELCSGCGKCVEPCPVDCIFEAPTWDPAPADWWEEPELDDPYA